VSKLKTGNIIFRMIKGRLVPLIAKGSDPAVMAQRAAAKKIASGTRKAIKKNIAARTSLHAKRIEAIKTARKFLEGKTNKIPRVGFDRGTSIRTTGDYVIKAGEKTAKESYKEIFNRFLHHNLLKRKRVGAESFLVKTSKRNILIQEKAKDIPQKILDRTFGHQIYTDKKLHGKFLDAAGRYEKKVKQIEGKARKLGLKPYDTSTNNIGIFRQKKYKSIDTDLYEMKKGRGVSSSERKSMKKFLIKEPRKQKQIKENIEDAMVWKKSYNESKAEELSYFEILKRLGKKK